MKKLKKVLIIISILSIIISCKTDNKKENITIKNSSKTTVKKRKDLLKINKLIKDLSDLMKSSYDFGIDSSGNIKYDSGTASNGRFTGNLKNLNIEIEYKNDNNDCDGCPAQGITSIIKFECIDNKSCLKDTGTDTVYSVGIITFSNNETANKIFNLLVKLKNEL